MPDFLNANNDLKNRYMHIDYKINQDNTIQRATNKISKCQNGSLECTLEELARLKIIKENPTITQKEMAIKSGKSERSIKRRTVEMQEKGLIQRKNGKRNGRWIVLLGME